MYRFILLCVVVFLLAGGVYSQEFKGVSPEDAKALDGVISTYNTGLSSGNVKMTLSSIGKEFIIFNGNYNADPTGWQAHLFRTGKGLKTYVTNFIRGAGPHENSFKVVHMYARNDAAVVVTRDTGKNKFRTWTDEHITWLLGKRKGQWKLTGYFIRDIKNPE